MRELEKLQWIKLYNTPQVSTFSLRSMKLSSKKPLSNLLLIIRHRCEVVQALKQEPGKGGSGEAEKSDFWSGVAKEDIS